MEGHPAPVPGKPRNSPTDSMNRPWEPARASESATDLLALGSSEASNAPAASLPPPEDAAAEGTAAAVGWAPRSSLLSIRHMEDGLPFLFQASPFSLLCQDFFSQQRIPPQLVLPNGDIAIGVAVNRLRPPPEGNLSSASADSGGVAAGASSDNLAATSGSSEPSSPQTDFDRLNQLRHGPVIVYATKPNSRRRAGVSGWCLLVVVRVLRCCRGHLYFPGVLERLPGFPSSIQWMASRAVNVPFRLRLQFSCLDRRLCALYAAVEEDGNHPDYAHCGFRADTASILLLPHHNFGSAVLRYFLLFGGCLNPPGELLHLPHLLRIPLTWSLVLLRTVALLLPLLLRTVTLFAVTDSKSIGVAVVAESNTRCISVHGRTVRLSVYVRPASSALCDSGRRSMRITVLQCFLTPCGSGTVKQ
ncbi:hypothetical protein cyc_04101 [Cyclospora cayetanensis]|uniref:Uncharacterized protein n=1 Tax=Cyclospora cayetanensis TaxID=88456 RepID=A0A1D3D6I9_9EIME|nr:hypothetical protein cyc_04101 [Cyclospora cayetanensis]